MRLRTRGRRNMRRKLPRLSMTATSDISFMLLIFFLVTTSMDSEKGLQRNLPPKDDQSKSVPVNVERENVLTIGINSENQYLVNDTICKKEHLAERLIPFILEKKQKHIIEVAASHEASYDSYFYLQNTIVSAYRDARDQMAKKLYSKTLSRCSSQQRDKIYETLPQRISERFTDIHTFPTKQ